MSAVVLPFVSRVVNPNWMPNPDNWVWTTPEGNMQGFGHVWRNQPGLANLLWLVLDMERPPRLFDARKHDAFMLVLTYGAAHAGVLDDLVQLAELNGLSRFRSELSKRPEIAAVPRFQLAPLLLLLAERRLRHAHA